jgi:multidrug resistance efflux pump
LKRFWVLLIFLLVAGSLSYVLVERAESKSQEKTLHLSGHIGVTVTDLAFMVPGKIATIKLQEGQEVKAGEVIAELDPKDLRQEVEAAQGKLDMANAVPGRPARVRDADLKQARAGLELAKSRLGYATLTSPVNGVVLVRAAQPGEVAVVGATVLSVGDLDNVWFEGYLPETFLAIVRYGQKAEISVDTYPGKKYPGTVSFIADKAEFTPKAVETYKERVTQVYRTKISLANPNRELKKGMPAEAVIYLEGQKP